MKKNLKYIIIFVISVVITYITLCYCPMFRIKLCTNPIEYFIKSLENAFLVKMLLSLSAGLILCGIIHGMGSKIYINVKFN